VLRTVERMLLMLRVMADETSEYGDVVLDVEAGHRVGDVATALEVQLGRRVAGLLHLRVGRTLDLDEPVDGSGLLSGDVVAITDGETVAGRARPEPAVAVSVAVASGPDAGRSMLLAPGRYVVGRSRSCEIAVADPTTSRAHAVLTVSDDWVVCVGAHPDASSPVLVDGVEIDGSVPIDGDRVVSLGATRLIVRPFACAELRRSDRLGQIEFQRTPYRPAVVSERRNEVVGPIPTRPEPRRFQIIGVLGPLAAGLAMYAFTRQVQFLALTLMSPLVMIATSIDDRRSGRRSMRQNVTDFHDVLVRRRQELVAMRAAERAERWRTSPDLADLLQRAERRAIDLWARGRGAPDFLRLRIGLGTSQTGYAVELDRGGDDDLRDEAVAAIEGLTALDEVPVTIDLAELGVAGVHGRDAAVDGLVASLLVQAACLHSPDDLTIVAAIEPGRPFGWLKWLPHLRSVASPVNGPHLAHDAESADRLIAAVLDVVTFRHGDRAGVSVSREVPQWPRVLVVLDISIGADPADVARLLDLGPSAGVSVLCLANRPADVPHQANAVLAVANETGGVVTGALWSVDPDVAPVDVVVERLTERLADRAGRALAPVRDASTASLATSIPRSVDLLDVIGHDTATAGGITARWTAADRYALEFPIGAGAAGDLTIDLVQDGPHALIGGTSGAGKSELLQSMVASLASRYPSTQLNFLFVDYKGGASSKVFERLPHTVGYVTNLGADLAIRALTSLRAELNHRMALMEGRAKDLAEMREVAPAEAPPSLVIVVDEFATLVKEVPEFVAGVIDIAQRGRSLGIHLVLATQRPSGAVNENILANTNLRISLRMLDRSESSAVIGSPEAADIPVPLRGRAFARLGARQPIPFQSAYSGAPLVTAAVERPVLVGAFDRPHANPTRAAGSMWPAVQVAAAPIAGAQTHLDAVIDAIVAADEQLQLPLPRRPWCDALADVVELERVVDDPRCAAARRHPGRFVVAGLLDAPERQEQMPLLVDLEDGGGWLVFGSGGSGKTTVLRTVAASLHATAGVESVATVCFDFASRGLAGLRTLPSVIDVATGDDLEAVTRHLVTLDRELVRRRDLLARANAEHLTAYNESHAPLPRIVVLIDGIGAMFDAISDTGSFLSGAESWADRLSRIVVDGRQVGIHTVMTADRRNAVPSRLHAAIGNRLVLRHADESAYADHGIGPTVARSLDLAPGRGLGPSMAMVQIATVGADPAGRAQVDAIARLAAAIASPRTGVLASRPLPDASPRADLDAAIVGEHEVAFGIVDVTGETAVLDLRWSHVLVAGPPRSGRSSALATIAAGLADRYDVVCVGASASGLAGSTPGAAAFGRSDEIVPALDRIVNVLSMGAPRRPMALVVDDLDALDDPMLSAAFERVLATDQVRIVAAVESRALSGFTTNALLVELKRARRQLVLRPDDPAEFVQATGVKLPQRPGLIWTAGRGVLIADRIPQVVQVAVTAAATAVTANVSPAPVPV
jgi:DNA segregation ATPase FtsK/SpoIIIE, S-DNA-T family